MFRNSLLIVCALLLLSATAARAEWVVETIDSEGDQGQYATIALDSFGTPHAAWYDASAGNLMYAYREFFDGWSEPEVVSSGSTGKYASIAIDPISDMPAIAFMDEARGDYDEAMYAYYDGTWNVEQIVWDDDRNEGRYIDLAFTTTGTPIVSYHFNNGAFHNYGLNVVWRSGDGWSGDRVESRVWGGGEYGKHSAIAIDSGNQPHVIHRDSLNQIPDHSWRDGTGWHSEKIVGILSDYCGEYNDIAIATNDKIWASTFDPTTIGDNCLGVMSKGSGDWDKTEPECGDGSDFGKYTSIALDSANEPHVTFYADGELHLAVRSKADWDIEVLDDNGNVGQFTGIALDDADSAYIVYYDVTNHDMKFVWWMFPPEVDAIDPDSGNNDEQLTDVEVTGSGFTPESTVRLSYPDREVTIEGTGAVVASAEALSADFDLDGAWPGMWDVEVTNPAGTGSLLDGFEIQSDSPQLDSISPTSASNDLSSVAIELDGENFADSLTVTLQMNGQPDVAAQTVIIHTLQDAAATFDLRNVASGLWHVAISTDYGSDLLSNAFEVTCGAPDADFDAAPTAGAAPLPVQFTDATEDFKTCEVESWLWDFGNGDTSSEQNPLYTYELEGTYSVTLTVTAPGGSDTVVKEAVIQVQPGGGDHSGDDDDSRSSDEDDGGCCG
ncbi:MAG: PKD domain-containing protein [Candidatus Alcyoniella australis]|nr:PKD domain-containing protein [Candidatus Alcyoniella australis]